MTTKSPKAETRRNRKPHNARTSEYVSFNELLAQIANEPRAALIRNEQVVMSRSERLLRLMVDRALQGKVREVRMLLKLLAKSPALAATFREEIVMVISGDLAEA